MKNACSKLLLDWNHTGYQWKYFVFAELEKGKTTANMIPTFTFLPFYLYKIDERLCESPPKDQYQVDIPIANALEIL